MFTQCPECSVAFRVTAEVLKQAAGKVRCGGCGSAFNALDYLSEEKPAAQPGQDPQQSDLPELTPDAAGDLEADAPPTVISAEQSAALLKTLDELAGEDIRIEDTGIEWRVLSDDDDAADSGEFDASGIELEEGADTDPAAGETGSLRFHLQDDDGSAEAEEAAEPVTEEMRFDDNTPLPDDFDFESEPVVAPAVPDATAEPEPAPEEVQVDLALGDPDDWQDLLGEFDELAADLASGETADDEAPATGESEDDESVEEAAAGDEPESDAGQDTAASGIDLPDMDTQFAQVAESMGVDLSGTYPGLAAEAADDVAAEGAETADDSEATSIDEDLIAAAFETEAAERRDSSGDEPLDDDSFARETGDAEMADDSVAAELDEDRQQHDADEPEFEPEPEDDEAIAAEFDAGPADDDAERPGPEPEEDESIAAELDAEPDDEAIIAETVDVPEPPDDFVVETPAEASGLPPDFPVEINEDDAEADELADDLEFGEAPLDVETELAEREAALRDQLEVSGATESGIDSGPDGADSTANAGADEHEIPELTEEEKTINMLIDQDLLAIAVEDEEGFASTIVQIQPVDPAEEVAAKDTTSEVEREEKVDPLVETIIMEGETVRGELDEERSAADREALALVAASDEETETESSGPRARIGLIAAGVGLVVLLGLQYVHFSREALATVPAINNAIGPVYRALGMPVSPDWDVTGWRFEATKGSTDDAGERLTIYSRIGNTASVDLPLPLIHVSLTDRFEEVVGSRIMEPAEFVVDGADPRETVAPGDTFNAVIVIESPSADVTGFKLNVCYRLASGKLKCEVEDFK